jgi:hypothetical protein
MLACSNIINLVNRYVATNIQYSVLKVLQTVTVKPQLVFIGGPEKERWVRENNNVGAYIK